ncbi:MAG: hypothetical protein JO056_00900 [Alphaproteobacteria bacterium]|nr:hypothetical protein [Alphaproteobacteria bacterium]
MSTFDLQNPAPKPGDALRDEAANLLATRFGTPLREARTMGKKSDLYFQRRDFGKTVKIYVEAKDHGGPLTRSECVNVWSDYSGIVVKNAPAELLLVTRAGLTSDAQEFVLNEQSAMRHQTIWELENETLGLTEYVRTLAELFSEDGLDHYYVEGRARRASYSSDHQLRSVGAEDVEIFGSILAWLTSDDPQPVAVLGGYGAGKSSLAKRLVSHLAKQALIDPLTRRPVLIKLGVLSRYSSLEGLLGGMFTYEFPVDGFSVRQFMMLNKKGRLAVVLDGFDEMKHAMSWADFRSQITDLNKLTEGAAKVVLLGRPSAFLSDDEHIHILRGVKRMGDGWRRLPNWPEFHEYDLQDFSASERADFVKRYLTYRASTVSTTQKLPEAWVETRAQEVNQLATRGQDIFQKPVHAKILTDLASDPKVSLTKFSHNITSWQLYEMFFSTLAEREVQKEARRDIDENSRLEFLRAVAFWMWTHKSGVTHFNASDLPDELVAALPSGGAADLESKKREYLSGSFLERKGGDIYYFAHRSFAEFLVAYRMLLRSPTAGEQGQYSDLSKDGVLNFLLEFPKRESLANWIGTLGEAKGHISLEYLALLADAVGGISQLLSRLPDNSPWRSLIALFGEKIEFREGLDKEILSRMSSPDNQTFFLLLSVLQAYLAAHDQTAHKSMSKYAVELAAVLLNRVFHSAKVHEQSAHARLDDTYKEALDLAAEVLPAVKQDHHGKRIVFRGGSLLQRKGESIKTLGADVGLRSRAIMKLPVEILELSFDHVLDAMLPRNSEKATQYFRRAKNLKGAFVTSTARIGS